MQQVAARPAVAAAAAAAAAAAPLSPADLPLLLAGVRVVLVSPKTPANIGAVLRVAENFEAHDVFVVDPRCDPFCGEVAKTSCESAVMGSLRVAPTLAAALADCTGSIGFTRRAGGGRTVHASMAQLLARFPAAVPALLAEPPHAQQAAQQQQQQQQQEAADGEGRAHDVGAAPSGACAGPTVALVFGREESGLLESELVLCSHACSIPSGRSQPSLNLSHAVAVVLSQLFDAKQQRLMLEAEAAVEAAGAGGQQQWEPQQQQQQEQEEQQQQQEGQQHGEGSKAAGALFAAPLVRGSLFEDERVRWRREQALEAAPQAELEALIARATALLEAAGISAEESRGGGNNSNHGRKKQLMGHIRALLLRSQAGTAEVRALHWLCRELEGRQR